MYHQCKTYRKIGRQRGYCEASASLFPIGLALNRMEGEGTLLVERD